MTSRKSPSPTGNATKADPTLRERAEGAVDSARERAIEAYDQARDSASKARAKAGKQLGEAPLLALAGGLAAGAVLAALLPKSKAEQKLLGPVGGRLSAAGKDAIDAAREAGSAKLGELNITRDAGADIVRKVMSGIGEAARSSGEAAVGTIRKG